MVPVLASLTLLNVAVPAANPCASGVSLKVAVPSVTVVVVGGGGVVLVALLPQLVPTAITITIDIPSKTVPRRLFVAKSRIDRHASTAQISPTINRLGCGQSRRPGLKTEAVVVAENVTVPVGAAPVLPAGFEELSESTTTVSENAVFAATDEELGVSAAVVGALFTVMVGAVVTLELKLPSPG
jgi:hypothetical protein